MTQFWPEGTPIGVRLHKELAQPVQVRFYGAWHRVQHVSTPWRVDTGWWDGRRVWRDYFLVLTRSGWLSVIFHDLCDDVWYLHRLYD